MKKKIISSLLVMVLLLCAVPVAFPGVGNFAYACENTIGCDCHLTANPSDEPSPDPSIEVQGSTEEPEFEDPAWYSSNKMFVWVSRGRDAEGVRDDKIVMELLPVSDEQKEEYLNKYKEFSGWDDEDVFLYSPAEGFFTNQVDARLVEFNDQHRYGGKSSIEVGLLVGQENRQYVDPNGPIYYGHKAFNASELDYTLVLRVGELKIELPAEYSKADFTFAAKPDGNGGWDIILRDADGNDIEYTII